MTYRLTLDLAEERHAQWRHAAGRIGYQRLDVWAYDTLDAASDPDAGQVVGVETIGDPERVDLRARLTTAERERRAAKNACLMVIEQRAGWEKRAAAAEARVEALTKAMQYVERNQNTRRTSSRSTSVLLSPVHHSKGSRMAVTVPARPASSKTGLASPRLAECTAPTAPPCTRRSLPVHHPRRRNERPDARGAP